MDIGSSERSWLSKTRSSGADATIRLSAPDPTTNPLQPAIDAVTPSRLRRAFSPANATKAAVAGFGGGILLLSTLFGSSVVAYMLVGAYLLGGLLLTWWG